eukprot:g73381.t1
MESVAGPVRGTRVPRMLFFFDLNFFFSLRSGLSQPILPDRRYCSQGNGMPEPQEEIYKTLDHSRYVVFRGTKNLRHGMRRAHELDNPTCLKLCRDGSECERNTCPFTHLTVNKENGSCEVLAMTKYLPPIPNLLPKEADYFEANFQATLEDEFPLTPSRKLGDITTPSKRRRRRKRRNRSTPLTTPRRHGGIENRPLMFLTPQAFPYGNQQHVSFENSPLPSCPSVRVAKVYGPRRLDYSLPVSPAKSMEHVRAQRALKPAVANVLAHYPPTQNSNSWRNLSAPSKVEDTCNDVAPVVTLNLVAAVAS